MNGRYVHTRQMKRAKREFGHLKNYLGRVMRELHRKRAAPTEKEKLLLERGGKIFNQNERIKTKNSICMKMTFISSAKAEIRIWKQSSIVCTLKSNWLLSAQGLENPYDGYTLEVALANAKELRTPRPNTFVAIKVTKDTNKMGRVNPNFIWKVPFPKQQPEQRKLGGNAKQPSN